MAEKFKPYTEEELRAKKSSEKSKAELSEKLAKQAKEFRAKQERSEKINPEALAAVKEMDKQQMEALRKKLEGLDVNEQRFAEGTGSHAKAEEDEIIDLEDKDIMPLN